MTEREEEIALAARRLAFDEAVEIILALTEPGERAPAGHFASALKRAR